MSIVDEIRQDREKGAKRLESEYKVGLMALARRFCADESDANELVNRTFAIVVENIDSYIEQSAFFGWMSRILVNCHSKDVRRKSNEMEVSNPSLPAEAEDDDACARVFRAVDASLLRDAIEQLPSEIKHTLMMHYFMDMPIKDVARVLVVPSGTVMWRLHYARQILAAKLGANIKKPVVLLIAAALFLMASAAAWLVGNAAGEEETQTTTATEATVDAAQLPQGMSLSGPWFSSVSSVSSVPYVSSPTPNQGETTMKGKKAAAAALSATMAVGPLAAARGDGYQFIVSGEVVAATTGCSSESSTTTSLTSGRLADGCVYASTLEARYRTMDESAAGGLRSDKRKTMIISFK